MVRRKLNRSIRRRELRRVPHRIGKIFEREGSEKKKLYESFRIAERK